MADTGKAEVTKRVVDSVINHQTQLCIKCWNDDALLAPKLPFGGSTLADVVIGM
jgi:hypothetical protein